MVITRSQSLRSFFSNSENLGGHGDVDGLDELPALASVTFAPTLSTRRLVNFSF